MAKKRRVLVNEELDGLRLDQALAAGIEELSRRKARVLIDIGGVFLDGKRLKVSSRVVRKGQVIEAVLGNALERAKKGTGAQARAEDAKDLPPHEILHEDEFLMVVHKPSGLLTAPTPESDRNNLAHLLSQRASSPSISVVHRLDLPTSGILVFAKDSDTNKALSEVFRTHAVDRQYKVIVNGIWPEEIRTVKKPVGGKSATTHFRLVRTLRGAISELVATLETGRTHQIRLHCLDVGHGVLADPQYGRARRRGAPRMALHATVLGFTHPSTGEALRFEQDWPAPMAEWLASRS